MVCNRQLHLLVAIFGGLLLVLIASALGSTLMAEIVSNGFILSVAIVYMFGAANTYQTLMIIVLTIKLRRYNLKLFTADPASSELISRLSGVLAFYLYFVSIVSAIWTLLTSTWVPTPAAGIALVLIFWLPIIAMFALSQSGLSSLVRRAKWKTLNEIQAQVEELRVSNNLKDKETMEAINRLMDFHDRVKATRNSALNSGAILSFINSLLLPLLAFLLGNLDKLTALLP
jgi:hypothetical protein